MAITSDLSITGNTKARSSLWKDKVFPALLIVCLAASLLFVTGFAETSVVHNAAHDGRHSAGFPCH